MKIAAAPCSFSCFNKNNPTGSDKSKYYVSGCSFSGESGPTSGAVSGGLYIDGITVGADVTVTSLGTAYSGSVSFVFPARHWAFSLDGHATLAEQDEVVQTASLVAVVAGIPVPGKFEVTARIEATGQDVYEDWSQT